jgi:hypothetical protein
VEMLLAEICNHEKIIPVRRVPGIHRSVNTTMN